MTRPEERSGYLMRRARLHVRYRIRRRDAFMGRFGGGWQWALGFRAGDGARTVLVDLLTFALTFHRPS